MREVGREERFMRYSFYMRFVVEKTEKGEFKQSLRVCSKIFEIKYWQSVV